VPTLLPPTATLTPTVSAADLVAQADALTFQSKFDDAAVLYQRAIGMDGNNALAYAHWARELDYQAYLEMRDDMFIQAVKKAQTASQLAPNDPEVSIWLARAYDWSAIYDKALLAAQKAVQLAPNSAEAFAVLAEVELDNQKLADAERDAQKAVLLNANSGEAHRTLGYVLNGKKENASATAELEKAAQLDPNLTVRHFEVGAMYRGADNSGQAIPALERSIALYPRAARSYSSLGTIYRDLKQYDKSIDSFNAAIQINGQIAKFYLDLGQSHLAAGHLTAAMDAAQKGAALDPNNQDIKNLLAAIARAQATPVPATAGAATATPVVQPGIYVTNIQTDPPEVKNGQTPTFLVTFLNTLGVNADYTWYVKLFDPDKKNSFGETAKSAGSILPGSSIFSTFSNWKAPGATPCRQFIARVFYVAPDNTIVEFPKPAGDSFWYYFSVCQ
jgi:tetratricopeptide (TPR) repeat protein